MVKKKKCPKGCEITTKEIRFVRTYGPNKTGLYRCGKCNYQFSIRRESIFTGFHTQDKEIYRILKALCEGNGIRATARIFEISTNTVMRILKQAGNHCQKVSEKLIKNYHMEECQIDELWSFIKKRKQSLRR